ncbi:isocitrate/isopropylmalate family dehydrogenase [Streptomyces phaeochromogenes]|uniref:isocitrate/isopropylmalate family dehydrogenase n=1 Tax=Streptomyces phaeochromogenes TaxID=1923 RepID=UPI002DDA2756|nr:isocitrate/isopropylmalate family dehydrogenase [Streptomyces phaeochromogenes]WRZ34509.1 isocitrate/isopropylmalate family dehydrogenase [Streptomyces phaeochromogenes]
MTGRSTRRVAVIEGDDSAPEAVRPVVELIDGLSLGIDWVYPLVGDAAIEASGSALPPASREMIDGADTTLFGSSSGSSSEALIYLRWGKETYANERPCRFLEGARSVLADPHGIDFAIVRENLEDLYVGVEGDLDTLGSLGAKDRSGRPLTETGPGRFAIKTTTVAGSERVIRHAFELARRRQRAGRVTCTAKTNMLPATDGLFTDIARTLAGQYPDIEFETLIIDDFACRMVRDPKRFDVVVMPNLYGDILSDGAAGLIGGLGLAPSGCYGDTYAYFEPAHGTAPDLSGTNTINPTATLLSACMMLRHIGMPDVADALTTAVERIYAEGRHLTPDQGGSATATAFCKAVAGRM